MNLPKRIEVIREGHLARVLVDGEKLPFPILREAVTVPVHPDEIPVVHLTLFAEQVDVVNKLYDDEKETGS